MTYLSKKIYIFFIFIFCFIANISAAIADPLPSANARAISYTSVGQGTPLILIHAFPADKRLWLPQNAGLKNHFRVITLDLWGFGQSTPLTKNGQTVTMSQYADEVRQLMDQLHIQKAIIGGESMGGFISLKFLEKYPDRVEGLILADTNAIADSPQMRAKREAEAENMLTQGTGPFINSFLPLALSPATPAQTRDFVKKMFEQQTPTAMAAAWRGIAERDDTSQVLKTTKLPVLIITGNNDQSIPAQQSENMHALAQNSQLVILNSGHLSNIEQPEQWNQAVINMFYKNR